MLTVNKFIFIVKKQWRRANSIVVSQLLQNLTNMFLLSPFLQIDIIGAVVIVWRVRGKIIRSVLCNIVCKLCTVQCTHI